MIRSKHPCAPMGCPHCSEWRKRSGPRRRAARPTALGVARLLPLPQAPRRRIGSSLQPAKVRALGTAGPTAHAGYLVAVTGEGRKAGLQRCPAHGDDSQDESERCRPKIRASWGCPPPLVRRMGNPQSIGKVNDPPVRRQTAILATETGYPRRERKASSPWSDCQRSCPTLNAGGRVGGRCAACSLAEARVRDGQCDVCGVPRRFDCSRLHR